MSKAPAFQFYPKDWRSNLKLRRCSEAARGAWIDVICVLHESEKYGIFEGNLQELVNAANVSKKNIKELIKNGVLKGSDTGIEDFIHRPNHAGKQYPPVTLIHKTSMPCWYSSRMVRDAWIRSRQGLRTRFTDSVTNYQVGEQVGERLGERLTPSPTRGLEHGAASAVALINIASSATTVGPVDNPTPEGRSMSKTPTRRPFPQAGITPAAARADADRKAAETLALIDQHRQQPAAATLPKGAGSPSELLKRIQAESNSKRAQPPENPDADPPPEHERQAPQPQEEPAKWDDFE
jgi:hypothetical protein